MVDIGTAMATPTGSRTPNWRENLVCCECGMNNRQRLVAKLVQQAALDVAHPRVYLMEQVTPMFEWVRRLPDADVHGSEYLGYAQAGGQQCMGSATRTSWPSRSRTLRST